LIIDNFRAVTALGNGEIKMDEIVSWIYGFFYFIKFKRGNFILVLKPKIFGIPTQRDQQ
jgi:hypothetical protein